MAQQYRLASRTWKAEPTVVELPGGLTIGGHDVVVIAGPCAVESEAQILETAGVVRVAGGTLLRGGAFKPRTSPYAFQGLGLEGLRLLAKAREASGLPIVTEAMDAESVRVVAEYADIIQIGSRNMHNVSLLRSAARSGKPILLKRGMAATIPELLQSAEYLLNEGNWNVILCERGLRGFDPTTRNVFDVAAIPVLRELSHLPIIADPSHGTGRREAVTPVTRAALAAGADGVLVEVHPHPAAALSDGRQSLNAEQFRSLMADVHRMAEAMGRGVASPPAVPAQS
ncbi:MAG: 3-deoxy-7-phosphoheptulonate synthase [Gemmatimonadota bacterium]|nr:3-deoxy-7-phosphoheptulonate synthase [Gemmatimonadota bacterium]